VACLKNSEVTVSLRRGCNVPRMSSKRPVEVFVTLVAMKRYPILESGMRRLKYPGAQEIFVKVCSMPKTVRMWNKTATFPKVDCNPAGGDIVGPEFSILAIKNIINLSFFH